MPSARHNDLNRMSGSGPQSPRFVAWYALREVSSPDFGGDAQETLGALAGKASLDPRDRGLAFELMQGVLRERLLLDAVLQRLAGFEGVAVEGALQDVLRLGVYQYFRLTRIPSHAIVHATVEIARAHLGERAAAFANAAFQRMVRQFPNRGEDLVSIVSGLPAETRYSFPGWIVRLVRRTVGPENLVAALEALNRPLPLYARANPAVASVEEVVSALTSAGIEAAARAGLARMCIEISGPVSPLLDTEIFRNGGLILQDASSQLVSEFVGANPGMAVVDFCSAPGGKTTALAAAMQGQGKLVACDVSESRMGRLTENIDRLGFASFIQTFLLNPSGQGLENLRGLLPEQGADRVLVDAPCSGLGTLRRHPEIRWRLKNADLKRLAELQAEILDRAVALVKPGGRLIYATCSLAAEENEQVVEAFLQRHAGEFEILKATEGLPGYLGVRINISGWLRLLPHREEMDSASAVRLERIK